MVTEEKRAYLIRHEMLARFKIAVTVASNLKLQNILAMPDEARTNMATEFFANGMTSRLVAVMAGELLEVPAAVYPRDWKEALKERFLPRWARRWWPVRYSRVVWEAVVLYPLISLPDEAHYLAEVRADVKEEVTQ